MRLGKDKQAIFLVVFLFFSASAGGQAGKNIKYQFNGDLRKSDAISEANSLIINYSVSELNIESIINDNGTFYRLSIAGHTPSSATGRPELPVYSRLITIPEGAGYKIKISEIKSSRIKPSARKIEGILLPAQEGETKTVQQKKIAFKIDKNLYSSRGIISSDTVTIEPLGILRDKRLYNLMISPVRYNPHSNVVEVITAMKIEVIFSYSGITGSKSLLPESALFTQSIDKGTLNYNPGEVIPGFTDQPVKMVIITDTAFRKHLEPFIRWKTQKGFKIKILYRGEGLSGNTYTELKDTLTKIYMLSSADNPPPEYLLIIGDVNKVPYYGTGNVTDMYYGEFDGNGDYLPDMYIGRLPVADTNELKTVVKKIIRYEKFEFADTNTFYSRALVTAGNDGTYAVYMNGQVNYAISNYLTTSYKINESHFNYPQSSFSTIEDSIKILINKGLSFINYSGHGELTGWTDPTIKIDQIPLLENKNMYPFIISNACQTGQFSSSSSFGNKLMVAAEKGAIGFIGCSTDSFWSEDFYWAVGPGPVTSEPTYTGKGLGAYDRMFHTHGEPASDWYSTMGQIIYAGNLAVSASTSPYKKRYWETYNLIGDPSVIPIIGKPDSFNISLPDTLPNGIKSLTLNADPFSYVAISHFDTLWDATFAPPSGSAVLNMPGLSDDSCLIVITGQNKLPLIKTVYFSSVNDEFINLSATAINDSQSNNNGRADFGETFFLKLTISNLGLKDATGLYAKISSTSDWLVINTDSANIGNLAAGSEAILTDKFSITLSGNVPDLGVATIHLILKDQKTEKQYATDIVLHAPELEIINCIMDDSALGDGDFIADPGETFNLLYKIRNKGSSDISGLFSISSTDSDISVLEPSGKSGLFKFGEITEIPIMVKLSESVSSGSYVSVSSLLDCYPYIVNNDFSFRIGQIRESFEASSFNIFPWINVSRKPWTITGTSSYDGSISARSGVITHNENSSLLIRTLYSSDDSIKFLYKVSSEAGFDYLYFKINDKEIFKKSGEIPWTKISIPVKSGMNKMEWIYKKDVSMNSGADAAWIDMIDFATTGSVTYIKRDLQVARIVTPFKKDAYGEETVTAKILNIGKDTIYGFNLAYEVNGSLAVVKQYFDNKVIPYGDSVTVSFKTTVDMSKYGIYDLTTYSYGNNDDYFLNDTMRITLENTEVNDSLIVFPNPVRDHLTVVIHSKHPDNLRVSITNVSGIKYYDVERSIINGKNEMVIDDIRLLPALYYLKISGAKINKTIPILIIK